jgi:hypothetical protein
VGCGMVGCIIVDAANVGYMGEFAGGNIVG